MGINAQFHATSTLTKRESSRYETYFCIFIILLVYHVLLFIEYFPRQKKMLYKNTQISCNIKNSKIPVGFLLDFPITAYVYVCSLKIIQEYRSITCMNFVSISSLFRGFRQIVCGNYTKDTEEKIDSMC